MNSFFMICFFVKRFWYKKIKYAFSRLFNQSNIFWSMKCGAIMICFYSNKFHSNTLTMLIISPLSPINSLTLFNNSSYSLALIFSLSNVFFFQSLYCIKNNMNIFLFNKSSALHVQSIQNKHALKSRPQDPANVKLFSWFLLLVLFATVNPFQFSMLGSCPILQGFLFSSRRLFMELTTINLWSIWQAWKNIANASSNMFCSIILFLDPLRLLSELALIIIGKFRNPNRTNPVKVMFNHKPYFSTLHYIQFVFVA